MKPSRTKPSPEAGERKALKKAWSRKSKERVKKGGMAHGMSMHQKRDSKAQGFSGPSQELYVKKKLKEEEDVDEGSLGAKRGARIAKSVKKAERKESEIRNRNWDKLRRTGNGKLSPKEKEDQAKATKKADDRYRRANANYDKRSLKRRFKRSQNKDLDEGSLGLKKINRLAKSTAKSNKTGEYGATDWNKYTKKGDKLSQKIKSKIAKDKFKKSQEKDVDEGSISMNKVERARKAASKDESKLKTFKDKQAKHAKKANFRKSKMEEDVDEGSLGKKRADRLKSSTNKAYQKFRKTSDPDDLKKARKRLDISVDKDRKRYRKKIAKERPKGVPRGWLGKEYLPNLPGNTYSRKS